MIHDSLRFVNLNTFNTTSITRMFSEVKHLTIIIQTHSLLTKTFYMIGFLYGNKIYMSNL